MIKSQLVCMVLLCISFVQANAEDGLRGSLITQDNQVVVQSDAYNKRLYPFSKSLSPVLGYVNSLEEGMKGLEKYADKDLSVGRDVYLNINMKLQQKIEAISDEAKIKADAEDVIVAVIESKTGKVLAIASSNRYDSGYIRQRDIPSIPLKFTEYPYEPGTVMSPFTLAIALELNLLTIDTVFDTYNGSMEYAEGKYIKDIEKYDAMSAANIMVEFSHIGMIQISWLLSGSEFRDGLTRFGFGQQTGIEFSRDLTGTLRPIDRLEDKCLRASNSLGYGMLSTFTQLLKAYNVFNNDGISVNPTIINNTQNQEKSYFVKVDEKRVISKKTSKQMYNVLMNNQQKETDLNTKYPNLELGGKKSTALIFKNGQYVKEYHSSFYGFANDRKGNKYTIGVLVIRPKDIEGKIGSVSASFVFEDVVEVMMEEKYIKF